MRLEDFNQRISAVKQKLYRFALKLMQDRHDAEDVVQDVLLKAWKHVDELDELSNFDAWCMRLVRNQSLDRMKSQHYRKQVHGLNPDTPSVGHNPYQYTELGDRVQALRRLINSLPEVQRQVIHLREVEGFSYQEIAEVMDLDLNTMKVYLFRARTTIRAKLLNVEAYGTK